MCKNEIMDMSYFSKTLIPFPPLSLVTALRKRKQPQKDTEAHPTPTSPSLPSHPTFCRQPCPPCLDLLPLVPLRASLCIDFPPLYWTIFTAYKHVVLVSLTAPPPPSPPWALHLVFLAIIQFLCLPLGKTFRKCSYVLSPVSLLHPFLNLLQSVGPYPSTKVQSPPLCPIQWPILGPHSILTGPCQSHPPSWNTSFTWLLGFHSLGAPRTLVSPSQSLLSAHPHFCDLLTLEGPKPQSLGCFSVYTHPTGWSYPTFMVLTIV